MQLEQISANVRYRTPWEGVDLGFVMARHWFLPLWGLWWMTALPVTLLVVLFLNSSPVIAAVVVWWLKPLYEPLLLFWLSRRLFGEELTAREVVGQWRHIVLPRLLSNLTLRRLSPNRSFYMPVSHLEGLRGKDRLKRLYVLSDNQSSGAWLTIVGVHIEAALELGLLLFTLYMVPEELLPESMWSMLTSDASWITWLGNAYWLLAMSAFAPFYVAGGFALYLTRRSVLEAWDLELAFRRMQPRFKSARAAALTLLLTLFAGAGLSLPQESFAEEGSAAISSSEVRRAIDEVLAGEDFGKKSTERYWKYVGPKKDEKDDDSWSLPDMAWLGVVAEMLEYLLWVVAAVAVGWLLLYLLQLTDWLPQRRKKLEAKPSVLFGMPITPESLPEDVAASIRTLLAEQRLRVALSLLYRATLMHLVHDHHVRIPDSATEGECQRIVAAQRPAAEYTFFEQLTGLWILCAYGRQLPAAKAVDELTSAWQQLYGAPTHE